MEYLFVNCPHCKEPIIIYLNEINCAIFRHGIYKETYHQIHPHMPKEECDRLILLNVIYGCGKPFRLIKEEKNYKAEVCDYI
jgi:hypothetical protein